MSLKKYIQGELSEAELEAISEELIQAKFDREKKNEWQQKLKNKYDVEKKIQRKWRFSNLSIAASFALVLTSSIYLIISGNNNNPNDVVNDYIKNLSIISEQKMAFRGSSSVNTKIENAALNYRNKKFNESITVFEQIKSDSINIIYYDLALCYLQKTQPEPKKAITLLLKSKTLYEFRHEIKWVLSLAYLKNNEKEKAIKELSEIVRENEFMSKEAQILLTIIPR